jgi:hypothetical protein
VDDGRTRHGGADRRGGTGDRSLSAPSHSSSPVAAAAAHSDSTPALGIYIPPQQIARRKIQLMLPGARIFVGDTNVTGVAKCNCLTPLFSGQFIEMQDIELRKAFTLIHEPPKRTTHLRR